MDVGFFDTGGENLDLEIEDGDLKADRGLQTAALISLYSDKRLDLEQLPRGHTDPRGWWADAISDVRGDQIGSRLWRLEASGKITTSSVVEFENLLADAFEWMIEDGLASEVLVGAQRNGLNELSGSISIVKPSGENIPFDFLWDGQFLKVFER